MVDQKSAPPSFSSHGWLAKFRLAIVGLVLGIKGPQRSAGQNSFLLHLPCAVGVIGTGIWLNVGSTSMAILILCIGLVFVAELINTSIEEMSRAITKESNANLAAALDIAAGSVLMASLTAVVVGGLILIPRAIESLGG